MIRPPLGQWVHYTRKALKYRQPGRASNPLRPPTVQSHSRWLVDANSQPGTGMFIGWRTVADVDFKVITEDWTELDRLQYHEVWLLVDNARHRPFYVFPDDCAPLPHPKDPPLFFIQSIIEGAVWTNDRGIPLLWFDRDEAVAHLEETRDTTQFRVIDQYGNDQSA